MNTIITHFGIRYRVIKCSFIAGTVPVIRIGPLPPAGWFILRPEHCVFRRFFYYSLSILSSLSIFPEKRTTHPLRVCKHLADGSKYGIHPPLGQLSLILAGFRGSRGWARAAGCTGTSRNTLPTKQSFLSDKEVKVNRTICVGIIIIIAVTICYGIVTI